MAWNLSERLEELRRQGMHRSLRLVEGAQGRQVTVDGRQALMFCSNNYLGLADHPRLTAAAREATARYGTSSGASRLVSGTMELHQQLEQALAAFKGTEAALVFNSGYAANSGIIPALCGRDDVVFSDRLNHASIVDGILLSRARMVRYPHNDMAALRRLLEETPCRGERLIVTDGVFSMDGDLAPLRELAALKREFGALLMVDDAHGTGVLGETGRGSAELAGVMAEVDIHMGTLGKALGSFGAYAAARADIVDWLVNSSRSFIFSTSLPPAVLAASLAALEVVASAEGAGLRQRLAANTARFRQGLLSRGLVPVAGVTQIVPLVVGEAAACVAASRHLLEAGVFVQAIRPPTVPAGTSRLRFTLMASHRDQDIDGALEAVAAILAGKGA
jgi:glycine C-acetyltransferase